jgi:hypothetical protein
LVTLAKLHRASGTEVDSDTTQSTWVARQFLGPALDWVGDILATQPRVLDNFDGFTTALRKHFGITDALILSHLRTQLDALHWHRDLPTFFAEFDRLSFACGMGGENSGKTTLLISKVPDKFRTILARQTPPPVLYSDHRERLLTIWATDPSGAGAKSDKETAKPACGRCGKRGHTASNCRTPRKE